MRQLLETAQYAPTRGRFKVYVIDEVHQLSGHAFNAMLKTLEEPPEHMKFILATTDPQKIPVTVLSRCLQFNLKQMPREAIAAHLASSSGKGTDPVRAGGAGAARARGGRQHARRAVAARPGDRARRRQGGARQAWATCSAPSIRATSLRLVGGGRRGRRRGGGEGRRRDAGAQPVFRHGARRSGEPAAAVAVAQSLPDAVDDRAHRRACRAARCRIGAALLPDRAAGQGRPAARAGRARGVRDDGAAPAGVQAGRRRASDCRCRQRRNRSRGCAKETGQSWPELVQQLPVTGAASELARNAELGRRDGSRVRAGGAKSQGVSRRAQLRRQAESGARAASRRRRCT